MNAKNKEFWSFNTTNKLIQEFGETFPNVEYNISPTKQSFLYTKLLAKKKESPYFVAAYDKFPIIRIYNDKGNIEHETMYDNGQNFPYVYALDNPTGEEMLNTTINYTKIKTTERYIYCLYVGKTLNAYSAESGHPFRKLTDTFLEKNRV